MEVKKVVLAYSGGLDTSVIIDWLKKKYDCEVIAFSAELGQGEEDYESIKDRALKIGASKVYIEDLKEEFVSDYIIPAIKANAVYEGKYYLATALGRPLISKRLVAIAKAEGADAIAHGCTGKGNDQVRIEASAYALMPEVKIIAPVRTWEMKSRQEEIEYAKTNNIPISVTKEKIYSIDVNIWGRAIECGVLEDPAIEPPEDIYDLTASIDNAPDKAEYIELEFVKGVPVALNGKKSKLLDIINSLNDIGGKHGIGRLDMIENRLVGIKSREIYEAPAAEIIMKAHKELETLTLDRETLHYKEDVSRRYSELVYYGLWFSPLREALQAFVDETQKNVTGTVRIKLHKGSATCVGRTSEKSLYNYSLATYDPEDKFEHQDSEGFIKIWSLPLKVVAGVKKDE